MSRTARSAMILNAALNRDIQYDDANDIEHIQRKVIYYRLETNRPTPII